MLFSEIVQEWVVHEHEVTWKDKKGCMYLSFPCFSTYLFPFPLHRSKQVDSF